MLRIVLILVLVGIFAVGAIYLVQIVRTGQPGRVQSAVDSEPTIREDRPEVPILEPFQNETLVEINQDGFSRQEVRVRLYTEVIFQNNTDQVVRIESMPNETNRKDIILGDIQPGQQATFEPYFEREYPFYDVYHPERTGKIIVE
jgi:hypothetical protein